VREGHPHHARRRPTTPIEVGGWRILTDPTFDPPGRTYRFGWGTGSRKLVGWPDALPRAVDEVPGALRELFGWAVREGVTDAVRHSGATHVGVLVSPVAVEISDDGRGSAGGPGSGLAGLAERAARLGGKVEAGPVEGGYRLRVEVPPSAPAAAPAAAAGVPAGGSGSG